MTCDKRVVGFGLRKALPVEQLGEDPVASAVVQNPCGLHRRPKTTCSSARKHFPWDAIPGNPDQPMHSFSLYMYSWKSSFVKMVKSGREDETATRAAIVIDGRSREIKNLPPVNLAVLVKIHNAVKKRRSVTALARRIPLSRMGLQTPVHPRSPGDNDRVGNGHFHPDNTRRSMTIGPGIWVLTLHSGADSRCARLTRSNPALDCRAKTAIS